MDHLLKINANGEVERRMPVSEFVNALQEWRYEHDLTYHPILCQDSQGNKRPYAYFAAEPGKKYIKIVTWHHNANKDRSVYCFLDQKGNIYKAASWKAPAKHIRGSVFDENYSLGKGLTVYGARYL